MTIELTDEAERQWLIHVFQSLPLVHSIHLFKSSFTPVAGSSWQDFVDNECDFSGYGGVQPAAFSPITTIGGKGSMGVDCVSFWHDGGETANSVGGWFHVTNQNVVLGYETFGSPVTMDTAGDEIIVCPRYCLSTGCVS